MPVFWTVQTDRSFSGSLLVAATEGSGAGSKRDHSAISWEDVEISKKGKGKAPKRKKNAKPLSPKPPVPKAKAKRGTLDINERYQLAVSHVRQICENILNRERILAPPSKRRTKLKQYERDFLLCVAARK